MRKIAVLLMFIALVGGCSSAKASRKDPSGNPIASGQDWSVGAKDEKPAATKEKTRWSAEEIKAFGQAALDRFVKCGIPPTMKSGQFDKIPPQFDPNAGMPAPHNDFLLQASISPTKGDPGTPTTITATAVGQPGALIVIIARFFDGQHHGMRAARTTDATGSTKFVGPIPKTAPKGIAYIYVSASTGKTNKSALKLLKFTVTGPGCR